MVYNFKEYNPVFDTPSKRQQERMVANKIMDLLNKNKYDNLEEFIKRNNSYQDFLKNNSVNIVAMHFGTSLTESDYTNILENLRVLTKQKNSFETKNIKTTNFGNEQYNVFEGDNRTYYIDNSLGDKSIEEQMKELQPTSNFYQTSNKRENTENMFKELANKKETLNLPYLSEINYDLLTEKEKELYKLCRMYQYNKNEQIRVDFQRAIIVNQDNTISKIENKDGRYTIVDETLSKDGNAVSKEKQFQKTLVPKTDTIYSE